MTRSYVLTHRKATPGVRRKTDASVTNLGFACFRLIAIDDRTPDEPAYAWIQVQDTRNAMASLISHGPSKRERFMRQVSALDRVLQASLRVA
jgi:hypothetical protein